MRILDCKSPICSGIAEEAPTVLQFLCDDCKEHFESVKKYLDAMNIEYTVNPQIVRGLDYYTRTVLAAWDWDGKKLTNKWTFDSNNKKWNSYKPTPKGKKIYNRSL